MRVNRPSPVIVGYQPAWMEYAAGDVQFDKLTHVNFAFVLPTPQGGVAFQRETDEDKLRLLVSDAHARGVKVLVSVGGWLDWDNSAFEAIAASASLTETFVANVADFLKLYTLDGVDIDWEFPLEGSAQDYANMMGRLSQKMREGEKLLTAAVHAVEYYGQYIRDEVFGYVDFLNLMAYEGGDGDAFSPYEYALASWHYWLEVRGLPGKKAVLGVPFYGMPGGVPYRELIAYDARASDRDVTNYPTDPDNPGQVAPVYYNGIPTIKRKTALALEKGAGVMVWELSQDVVGRRSLLKAIFDAAYKPPQLQ